MKLKKIASLMLAGIMAVSMLAGCKDAASSKPADPEVPEVTPVVDAATTVNGKLDDNKDKIKFENDSIAAKIMESYFEENPIVAAQWSQDHLNVVNDTTTFVDVRTTLGEYFGVPGGRTAFSQMTTATAHDGVYMELYLLNSKFYTMEDALEAVGSHLDGVKLADTDNDDDLENATVNFSYTGKVAAVKAESKSGAESMWVVAAVVERDSAKR